MRKAHTSMPAALPDEEPELIVDREFKNPRPLDRNICTVSLKTPANNPTEGYDLLLSATFGKERVRLVSDEFEIEVDFSINTANIELAFGGCDYTEINVAEGGRVEEWRRTITQQLGDQTRATANVGGSVSINSAGVSANAQAAANFQKSAATSSTIKQEITRHDWHRLGGDTIKVGPTGQFLYGPIITDFHGWRVTPHNPGEVSGVVARVKVREQWINFENVQVIKSPSRLVDKVKMLMTLDQAKRKQYFNLLLRHLVQTELRDHQEGTDATIASHVLRVRPHNPHATSAYAGQSRRQIAIDGRRVDQWLAAEEGHEVGALIAIGLRPEVISPVAGDDEPKRAKRGSFFIPESAPPHAAATFEHIYRRGSIPKAEVLHPTALHDLRALKLIATDRGEIVRSVAKEGLDANVVMRRAVSEMECINVTRQVLRIKPTASPLDIAEAVALELGKTWPTEGTKRRNGNAILRWMLWLEPHLLDASSSSDAAARIAYATDASVVKGRPGSLRKAREPELRRLLNEGVPILEIARRFDVAPGTIYNWMAKLDI